MHEPLILDDRKLLIDHHARIAAVEVEVREARSDVGAALHSQSEIQRDIAELTAVVMPLAREAASSHQQAATLLTYLFSACLAVAGGTVSAWLSGLAKLSSGDQIVASAGAALVCVLVARLAVAHSHHS